jgi:hypothetical protein
VQLRSLRKREGGEPEAEQRYFEGQSWSESSRSSLFACSTSSTTRPRNTVKNSYYHHNNRNMRLARRRARAWSVYFTAWHMSLFQLLMCTCRYRSTTFYCKGPQLSHALHTANLQVALERKLAVEKATHLQPASSLKRLIMSATQ